MVGLTEQWSLIRKQLRGTDSLACVRQEASSQSRPQPTFDKHDNVVVLPDGETKQLSEAAAKFFAVGSDPLGDARNGSAIPDVRIPDWSTRDSYTAIFECSGEYQVAANTNPKGIIKLCKPNTSFKDALSVCYAAAGASAPSLETLDDSFMWNSTSSSAMSTAVFGTSYRIIAAGLKVRASATTAGMTGSLRGGNFPTAVHAGAGNWASFGPVSNTCENKIYQATDGITVRLAARTGGALGPGYGGAFADSWAALGTATAYTRADIPLPTVLYDGLSDCTLHIQAIMYVEFEAPSGSLSVHTRPSKYDPDCLWLYNRLGDYNVIPVTVAGHSFRSFFRNLASSARSGARKAFESPLTAQIASAVSPEAGAAIMAAQQAYRLMQKENDKKRTKDKKKARSLRRVE